MIPEEMIRQYVESVQQTNYITAKQVSLKILNVLEGFSGIDTRTLICMANERRKTGQCIEASLFYLLAFDMCTKLAEGKLKAARDCVSGLAKTIKIVTKISRENSQPCDNVKKYLFLIQKGMLEKTKKLKPFKSPFKSKII